MFCFQNSNCGCRCCPIKPSCAFCTNCHGYGTIYNNLEASVTIDTAGAYVPVTLNTTGVTCNTTITPNAITIEKCGTYVIYYNLNVNGTESQTLTATVFVNGTTITPSTTSVAMSTVSDGVYTATLSAETLTELNAGDVVSLQLTSDTASTVTVGNLADATLSVKKV